MIYTALCALIVITHMPDTVDSSWTACQQDTHSTIGILQHCFDRPDI